MCEFCESNKKIKHGNVEFQLGTKIPLDLWINGMFIKVGLFGVNEKYEKSIQKRSIITKQINFCPMCGRNLKGD